MEKPLGELRVGEKGKICSVRDSGLSPRLLEMGLVEGSQVEVVRAAPFGGDPIAVRSRGTLVALRREEANLVEVRL